MNRSNNGTHFSRAAVVVFTALFNSRVEKNVQTNLEDIQVSF